MGENVSFVCLFFGFVFFVVVKISMILHLSEDFAMKYYDMMRCVC